MEKIIKTLILLMICLLFVVCKKDKKPKNETSIKTEMKTVYEQSWESLSKHNEAPNWFQDAKLGIYFHWGVYSVPAFANEWYPRNMHFKDSDVYKHHKEKYGDPSEFGYHDFVPMFKAENFDAKEWADLFKKAGARFAGPVAEHHDGFSMWDSKVTPWNAKNKGPKRDVTGELQKAITNKGMKFITTFHHSRNLQRYSAKNDSLNKAKHRFQSSHYPYIAGMPPTDDNSELALLYGNIPEEQWNEKIWFGKLKEVIDQYQPDIIWFDSWLDQIPVAYRQKFAAYYLNQAEKLNKEVVIVRKQNDLPLDFSVDDLEKSRKNTIEKKSWMTDETVSTGSWCYTEGLKIKSAKDVLHVLIDIVSKNGVLLLNISPKADGTILADQRTVLLKIGAWLDKYGQAIYGTRPWYTFGEGPTKEPEGSFKNHKEFLKIKYSAKDIRYTTKGNTIYAIVLGSLMPGKEVNFTAFTKSVLPDNTTIKNIAILGIKEKTSWRLTDQGLSTIAPFKINDTMATVFKIDLK